MKLNPPNARRSQIKICEKRQTRNVQFFGSCKTRFEFLSQFRKVRNAFECFVTQVQTCLPKTKRVWPMKINMICTVRRISTQCLDLAIFESECSGRIQWTPQCLRSTWTGMWCTHRSSVKYSSWFANGYDHESVFTT